MILLKEKKMIGGGGLERIFAYCTKFLQLVKVSDIVDIIIISFIIYQLLKLLKDTRALRLIKGIVILFLVMQVSAWLNLTVVNYILRNVMQVGFFALVVIFQPELRSMLERMGRSKFSRLIEFTGFQSQSSGDNSYISELVDAAVSMSSTKTGALIVLERDTKISDVITGGTVINAEVTADLLENIFFPKAPLHDGAVIIRDKRVQRAACVLPLTSNENLSRELGTRHRAALGISENSDAVVIVVSEETGKISVAINGTLTRNLTANTLKNAVTRAMQPKEGYDADKIKFRRWAAK